MGNSILWVRDEGPWKDTKDTEYTRNLGLDGKHDSLITLNNGQPKYSGQAQVIIAAPERKVHILKCK